MESEIPPRNLTLLKALIQWCDPALVEAVRVAERGRTAHELLAFRGELSDFPKPRLTPANEWRQPSAQEWMHGATNFTLLSMAWEDLTSDFRTRVETGAIFLEGVEVDDTHDAEPQSLRGAFASEYKFDFKQNALRLGKKRYVAIVVSRTPRLHAEAGARRLARRELERPLKVDDLTDDEILELLSEHNKRVVDSPEPKMMARVKYSLDQIVIRRLEWRFGQGLTKTKIREEAAELRAWIVEVAPWHQKPAVKTVENHIRKRWNELKSRSNTPIS